MTGSKALGLTTFVGDNQTNKQTNKKTDRGENNIVRFSEKSASNNANFSFLNSGKTPLWRSILLPKETNTNIRPNLNKTEICFQGQHTFGRRCLQCFYLTQVTKNRQKVMFCHLKAQSDHTNPIPSPVSPILIRVLFSFRPTKNPILF